MDAGFALPDGIHGLLNQRRDDFGDRTDFLDHAHGLTSHDRTRLHVTVDDGTTQGTGPVMLDRELGFFLSQLATLELPECLALQAREVPPLHSKDHAPG